MQHSSSFLFTVGEYYKLLIQYVVVRHTGYFLFFATIFALFYSIDQSIDISPFWWGVLFPYVFTFLVIWVGFQT